MTRSSIRALTAVIGVILLGLLAVQVLLLPYLAAVMAQDAPEFADLRYPVLGLSIAVLGCVQVVLVVVWRLLGSVATDRIFTPASIGQVDVVVGAVAVATALVVALTSVLGRAGAMPPLLLLVLLGAVVGGVGLTLLVVVLRALLRTATADRAELAEVV